MKRPCGTLLTGGALLLGALAVPSALAQQAQHHGDGGAMGVHGGAMQTAMERMQQGMAVPMSGDPDVDFATMMIPHHQGAIEMARAQLEAGKDPQLRELAAKIIADQEREIATLEEWLAKRPK
jgi:uncharacterized protein (DUF305 family)